MEPMEPGLELESDFSSLLLQTAMSTSMDGVTMVDVRPHELSQPVVIVEPQRSQSPAVVIKKRRKKDACREWLTYRVAKTLCPDTVRCVAACASVHCSVSGEHQGMSDLSHAQQCQLLESVLRMATAAASEAQALGSLKRGKLSAKVKKKLQQQLTKSREELGDLNRDSPLLALCMHRNGGASRGGTYTVEEAIRLEGATEGRETLTQHFSELLRRLRPRGATNASCDLAQAYLSTPAGRALLPSHVPSAEFCCSATDQDMEYILQHLDTQAFEYLLCVHVVTHQMDAGAVNLMLRAEHGKFQIVLIDTADSFPCGDGESSSSGSGSSSSSSGSSSSSSSDEGGLDDMLLLRGEQGEYPLILEIGLADAPPTEELVRHMASIPAEALQAHFDGLAEQGCALAASAQHGRSEELV